MTQPFAEVCTAAAMHKHLPQWVTFWHILAFTTVLILTETLNCLYSLEMIKGLDGVKLECVYLW